MLCFFYLIFQKDIVVEFLNLRWKELYNKRTKEYLNKANRSN